MEPHHAATLRAFLDDLRHPSETLSYHALQGFLFTIASAPELVMPSEWRPEIFGGEEPIFDDLEQAQEVTAALMALYNAINASVFSGNPVLPDDCIFWQPPLANFSDDAPMAEWSRGFVFGHEWLEDSWRQTVPDALEQDYSSYVMVLSFFAERFQAEAACAEIPEYDLAGMAAIMIEGFQDALAGYAILGRSIHQVLSEDEQRPAPVRTVKVGRNDPCPCGSGRKYKKCCGAPN